MTDCANVTAATPEELDALRSWVDGHGLRAYGSMRLRYDRPPLVVYRYRAPRLVLREDVEDLGLDPANDPDIIAVLEPDGTETRYRSTVETATRQGEPEYRRGAVEAEVADALRTARFRAVLGWARHLRGGVR